MSAFRRLFFYCGVLLGITFGFVAILFIIAIARTLLLEEVDDYIKIDSEAFVPTDSELERYVEIFGGALQHETVSTERGKYNREELRRLLQFLSQRYPLVFNNSVVEVEVVNELSLLLTVHGSDPSLKPYLLTAHMDVVPVDPDEWSHPPFLGKVVEDPETGEPTIWGRGALDNKAGVIGILSALDLLFTNNWSPLRTFYVGFGHDEEVSGNDGAGHIAKVLIEKKAQIDFLLDEGAPILHGVMQGIDSPVAMVGVTEKGRMEVRLTAQGEGGHSSIPPKVQAVEILSKAISNLYRYPQPSMFGLGPEEDLLKYLAPKANWPHKLLFSNTWLFRPLLSYFMTLKRESNAVVRTTTAVTIVNAGYKSNVIPATATAQINHRVHPSQSLEEVLAHDTATIGDSRVKVEVLERTKPHPVSPYGPDSIPFNLITRAVKEVYPDSIAVPAILVANTDTVHYLNLTRNVYRFNPGFATVQTLSTIHGKNERLSISHFKNNILIYEHLILFADKVHKNIKFQTGRKAGEL